MEQVWAGGVLWGPDHVDYGELAVEAVGDDIALAISRGAEPKPYWSLDPNEDAVAGIAGPRATLLICADGHNGFDSVGPAVQSVLDNLGDDPPPPGEVDPIEVFARANMAAMAVTSGFTDARSQSRTTLAFALIADRRVQWAAMGDAPVYLTGSEGSWVMIRDEHYFLPYVMGAEQIADRIQTGEEGVEPGSWVILASDGFSDYAGDGRGAIAVNEATGAAPEPPALAEALVRRAFDGGAGDNVAVALTRVL